jgi:hypothetical protein
MTMLEYREIPDTNIVELSIDRTVSGAEFDETLANLEAAIRRHGTVRILEHVRSFRGMPIAKFLDDIKFGFRNMKHFSHAAVVADPNWVALLTNLSKPFVSGEVRYFKEADIDRARQWLRASSAPRRRRADVNPALLLLAAVALLAWWKRSRSR